MSLALLELAADALGPLLDEVMFVGGASVGLWITDPAAPPPRPTKDVDVVVEVTTRLGYERFARRMRAQRFREDIEGGIVCRWRHSDVALLLDAMPADPRVLGFASRWHTAALPHAARRTLPSGSEIRAIAPPHLVATKLEALKSRGGGDLIASRDFADIVALLDGRAELVGEIESSDDDVRSFVAEQLAALRRDRRLLDAVAGALPPDAASQARAETLVLPRLDQIARAAPARPLPLVDPALLRAEIDELIDPKL
jgi:predicted nucleotidyltransferase